MEEFFTKKSYLLVFITKHDKVICVYVGDGENINKVKEVVEHIQYVKNSKKIFLTYSSLYSEWENGEPDKNHGSTKAKK